REMGMGVCQGDGHDSLCRADIGEGGVVLPRESRGNGLRRARAETGHRPQEPAQPFRFGVERREEVSSALSLVLELAGSPGLRKGAPKTVRRTLHISRTPPMWEGLAQSRKKSVSMPVRDHSRTRRPSRRAMIR